MDHLILTTSLIDSETGREEAKVCLRRHGSWTTGDAATEAEEEVE